MATISGGDISRRLGIALTAEFIHHSLGFEPVGRDKRATLWDEATYPLICDALAKFCVAARNRGPAPKPPKVEKPKKTAAAPAPATKAQSADDDWEDEDEL